MPNTGVVVTPTSMSNNWRIVGNINVKGTKTVGGALSAGSGVTGNAIINYITGGTCIGTKNSVCKYLVN